MSKKKLVCEICEKPVSDTNMCKACTEEWNKIFKPKPKPSQGGARH